MKAVILAAGMGERLRPRTDSVPKGLIEIGGVTLLERSLDSLRARGLRRAYIVTGYLGPMIRAKIGARYKGLEIIYADNPEYSSTGSMYSLSRLEHELDDDIVLLESDLLYEPRALQLVLEASADEAMLTAEPLNEGDDVYVCTGAHNQIVHLGKALPERYRGQVVGCLVGISKFSLAFMRQVFARARQEYKEGCRTAHYEECVLRASLEHRPVYAVHAPGLAWTEIDTERDLEKAAEEVYPRMQGRQA